MAPCKSHGSFQPVRLPLGGQAVFGDLTVDANLTAGGQLLHRTPGILEPRRMLDDADPHVTAGETVECPVSIAREPAGGAGHIQQQQ